VAPGFEEVVVTARLAFSRRSWPFVLATTVPWLLCAGQRCWTRVAALGRRPRSRSACYRFLSGGKWRLELLFRALFEPIARVFRLPALTLVLDDTPCPGWGRSIYGAASFFDHARRPHPGSPWGHNGAVVPVGSSGFVALPYWIAPYRSETSCRKGEFQTRHQRAAAALARVRAWFAGPIRSLAGGAYADQSRIASVREQGIHLVSRLRGEARLRAVTAPRRPEGRRGRKPKWGRRLPRLAVLARR
jgi:hypothetical protein